MQVQYDGYRIDLYDEKHYDRDSADNTTAYDNYYGSDDIGRYLLTQHGISIADESDEVIARVCIGASGGATTIHKTSFVIAAHALTICCANTLFSLDLPELNLRWNTIVDNATAFEVLRHRSGFIVHGELLISRIGDDGSILWQFSGPDIFTTPDGNDVFRIEDDRIYASGWESGVFILDAITGVLLEHQTG